MRSVARRSVVLGIGASPLLAMGAHAQGAWPSQSIRLVVPFAPAGTPAPIIARLNRDVLALLQTADIRNRFAELGGTPGTYSAADYNSFIIREVAKWAPLVQAAGATAD